MKVRGDTGETQVRPAEVKGMKMRVEEAGGVRAWRWMPKLTVGCRWRPFTLYLRGDGWGGEEGAMWER